MAFNLLKILPGVIAADLDGAATNAGLVSESPWHRITMDAKKKA